jgi:hypothetical protein
VFVAPLAALIQERRAQLPKNVSTARQPMMLKVSFASALANSGHICFRRRACLSAAKRTVKENSAPPRAFPSFKEIQLVILFQFHSIQKRPDSSKESAFLSVY